MPMLPGFAKDETIDMGCESSDIEEEPINAPKALQTWKDKNLVKKITQNKLG